MSAGDDQVNEVETVIVEERAHQVDVYRRLAQGLAVRVVVSGFDLVVRGSDLDRFLARLDPDVWSPERAQGDA